MTGLTSCFKPREIVGHLIEDKKGYRLVTDWREIYIDCFDKDVQKLIPNYLWSYVRLKGLYNKKTNQFVAKEIGPAGEPMGLELLAYSYDAEFDIQECQQKILKQGSLEPSGDEFAS